MFNRPAWTLALLSCALSRKGESIDALKQWTSIHIHYNGNDDVILDFLNTKMEIGYNIYTVRRMAKEDMSGVFKSFSIVNELNAY